MDFAKKLNFCKFAIFLQILKVEHNSIPMMYHLSYLDIKYGIDVGGGAYPGFQTSSVGSRWFAVNYCTALVQSAPWSCDL